MVRMLPHILKNVGKDRKIFENQYEYRKKYVKINSGYLKNAPAEYSGNSTYRKICSIRPLYDE